MVVGGIYTFVSFLILFFLLSPLLSGVISYLCDLYRYRNTEVSVPPSEIFGSYMSLEAILRSWKIVLLRLGCLLLVPLALISSLYIGDLLFWILGTVFGNVGSVISEIMTYVLCAAFLLGALYLCYLTHPLLYLTSVYPDMPIGRCLSLGAERMKRHFPDRISLFFGFLPWILGSVLSVGILFFIYVLPYMLFTDISFCTDIRTD